MKISELHTDRTVIRKSRQPDNSISDEEKTFEIPYNPNVEILYWRLFAKLIDISIIIGIMTALSKLNILNTNDGIVLFPIFIFGVVIVIPTIESLTGTSLGKIVFGLEIVDDNCEKLTIPFSFRRNFYAYYLILLSLIPMVNYLEKYEAWQSTKKFYVIKRNNKAKIKNMMENKSFA